MDRLLASGNSDAQRWMADLLDQTFYGLSVDEREVLEAGLGEPWSDANGQEKVQFAAAPSLSGPLFRALQRTIQERTPKDIPCQRSWLSVPEGRGFALWQALTAPSGRVS